MAMWTVAACKSVDLVWGEGWQSRLALGLNSLLLVALPSIAISVSVSVSVCPSVCLSVCALAYVKNRTSKLHEIFCTCYPWLGPPPTTIEYVMYFRFRGWRCVFHKGHYDNVDVGAVLKQVVHISNVFARGRHAVWLCRRIQRQQIVNRGRGVILRLPACCVIEKYSIAVWADKPWHRRRQTCPPPPCWACRSDAGEAWGKWGRRGWREPSRTWPSSSCASTDSPPANCSLQLPTTQISRHI